MANPPASSPPDTDLPREPAALREALRSLTVKELRARAREWSVNLRGRKRKEGIVEALAESLVGAPAEEAPPSAPEVEVQELPFGRLEDLWIEAANRLSDGDYRSALAFAKDGLTFMEEWTRTYRRGMCATALQAVRGFLGRYEGERPHPLGEKLQDALDAYEADDLEGCAARLRDLQGDVTDLHLEQVERLRETLAEKGRLLEGLRGLQLDLTEARGLLAQAEEAASLDEPGRALDLLHRFEEVVRAARRGRREELEDRFRALEARLAETGELGASLEEPEKLFAQARDAFDREDLFLCDELVQRCDRALMEAQRRQVERVLRLRKRYFERVKDLVSHLKPLLREAEAYSLDIEGPRDLLRESLDLLRQEEYFAALDRGEAARAALEALLPRIKEERAERGVTPPEEAACRECHGTDLAFHDDGWGECRACGFRFVWSTRDLPRIITFLRSKLTP